MPRAIPKKQSHRQAPVRVDGIVFHVALHDDRWAETIGVAFEHVLARLDAQLAGVPMHRYFAAFERLRRVSMGGAIASPIPAG